MTFKSPANLKTGDRIAILSPASIINPDYVAGAVRTLRGEGFDPVVMPHTLGAHGSFSGTSEERTADMTAALSDPSIRAIICSRGGYGAVQLLEKAAVHPSFEDDPKWLAGFSDVSALHALWGSRGITSIHSSMTKQLALGPNDPLNRKFFSILMGGKPMVEWEASEANHPGCTTAPLLGGNLAVISALIATPYNVIKEDTILMIEDIAEPIYKVERILYQLRLAGILPRLAGLVVGQFTDYRPSRDHASMEAMIEKMVKPYSFPIAFNAPIGHVDGNEPLLLNAIATLNVSQDKCVLSYPR